jgi:hypothetical protein
MTRLAILLGFLCCWCCLAGRAAAEPLVLALYAPTAPLASAEARFAYVDRLARALRAAGLEVEGKAFARAGDLEGAIKRGQVDLAILDGIYLAERGVSYPILAVSTVGGETTGRWGLYTIHPKGNLQSLFATKLAWAQVASRDPTYLDNVLLDGEVKTEQFFSVRPPTPDVAAAVSEVVLRRAECVFAPEVMVAGKGLRRVFDAGRVPNPALVQVQAKLSRAQVAQVQKAVLVVSGLGGLDGWKPGADLYRPLRQRLLSRGAARRLQMVEPQPLLQAVRSEFLLKEDAAPALPPLRSLLQAPQGVP